MTNPLAGGSDKSNVKRKTVKNLYDGGTPSLRGTLIKIGLLGIVDAVTIFVLFVLWMQHQWIAFGVGLFTLLVVNFLFLRRGGLPAKYLTPGVLLLIAFQIYVLLFSAYTAFTNYGSAHNGSQEQAVSALVVQGADPVADGKQYDIHLVKEDATKKYAFLLTDPMAGTVLVAKSDGKTLQEVPACTQAVTEFIANNATRPASSCRPKTWQP